MIKILFQGGYLPKRDPKGNAKLVEGFIKVLAKKIVEHDQHIITTWHRSYDKMLTEALFEEVGRDTQLIRKHLTFYLPDSNEDHPEYGIVRRYKAPKFWNSERTISVSFCDAILIIGGGKGTSDSMEKAFLASKPVFIAYKIKGHPTEVWDRHAYDYHYLQPGDADFNTDENISPEEFFDQAFGIIKKLNAQAAEPEEKIKPKNISIESLRNLVAKGQLEKALEEGLKMAAVTDSGLLNQLTILSGSLYRYRKDKSLGLADKVEIENRIMQGFLEVLTDLEEMIH